MNRKISQDSHLYLVCDRETVVWTHTEVLINVKWSASLESIFQQTMRIVFNDQSWCCQSTTNRATSAAGEADHSFDWPTTLTGVKLFQAESMGADVPHKITHEYYYPVCVSVVSHLNSQDWVTEDWVTVIKATRHTMQQSHNWQCVLMLMAATYDYFHLILVTWSFSPL